MTATTAPTGRTVLAELAGLLDRYPDRDLDGEQLGSVLDELAAVLRRARGLLRRAAAKRQPEADPQPKVAGSGGESPVGKPATLSVGAVVLGDEGRPLVGRLRPVGAVRPDDRHLHGAGVSLLDRRGHAVVRHAATVAPPAQTAGRTRPPLTRQRPVLALPAELRHRGPRPEPAGLEPATSGRLLRGRSGTVLAGLARVAMLLVALAAVLLGASAAGEVAPGDVVPATAVGAALLAGMLAGRLTAPAVAAAITRRRRRDQTVAPTRAAT